MDWGLCVLCILYIFSGGREPEVEGVDSHVDVAVGKQVKKVVQKMEEAGECSYPYKNCVPATGASIACIQ